MRRILRLIIENYNYKLFVCFCIFLLISCSSSNQNSKYKNEKTKLTEVKFYPKIKDTTKFISKLKTLFEIEIQHEFSPKEHDKITLFKKVKIFGSDEQYYLIEFDYADSFDAAYPWKFQFLINSKGEAVKLFSAEKIELIQILENHNPFILTVESTYRGNGGHCIYKFNSDSLVNCLNNSFKTYDANEDNYVFEPNDLNLKFEDINSDGYRDLIFFGKMIFIQGQNENGGWYDGKYTDGNFVDFSIDNPYRKEDIELQFIYDNELKRFIEAENYLEKYKKYE